MKASLQAPFSSYIIRKLGPEAGFARPKASARVFSGRQTLPLQVSRALKRLNDT